MKSSLLLLYFLTITFCWAVTPAEQVYSALERRLQSLKSLEIRYEAQTVEVEGQLITGRMLWMRPDRFLHETPEWTLCETGSEQWRYLRQQNTLIRENIRDDQSEWLPEEVLFNMRKSFRVIGMNVGEDGRRILRLEPVDAAIGGEATLEFPAERHTPDGLLFASPDGTKLRYRIVMWHENESIDGSVFVPPEVPSENTIDFRSEGQSR